MLKKIMLLMSAAALIVGCNKSNVDLSASGAATMKTEVEQFERDFEAARTENMNLLAPQNFAKAEESKQEVKEMVRQDKDAEDISAKLHKAQADLDRAKEFSEKSKQTLAPVIEARERALNVGADKLDKDLQQIDEEFAGLSEQIEKDNVQVAMKKRGDVVKDYQKLEMKAIKKFKSLQ